MKKSIFKRIKLKHMYSNEIDSQEKILNGINLSTIIQNSMKNKLDFFYTLESGKNYHRPKLKVILVGERLDSKLYVENKIKMCKNLGILSELKTFPNNTSIELILKEIENSNIDETVHGIIVQLPLPNELSRFRTEILSKVDLRKDVDGLNPLNQGKVLQMNICQCLLPPTSMGVLELLRLGINYKNNLDSYFENYLQFYLFDDQPLDLSGLEVTVLGRGLTAGLPISILMQICNGTVTTCHSKTKDVQKKCQNADILISAVGMKNLVTSNYVKEQSIIIDVGINVEFDSEGNKSVCGDVDFNGVFEKVKFITPVPGGVGKMTVIMLLKNVIKAWENINNINLNKMV